MTKKTDHDMLVEIHTVLMGANGNDGLCRQVKKNTDTINRMIVAIAVIFAGGVGGGIGIYKAVVSLIGG